MAEVRRPAGVDVVTGVEDMRPSLGRLFIVIGVFDGLHRGHTYLLEHLRAEARARSARPTVITFDHHPDEVIVGAAPPLLCDPEERLDLLSSAGVDVTVIQPFNETVRRTEYGAFVATIATRVDLAGFLMTPEAAFGYERRGTPQALTALGEREGFDVVVVPPFEVDGRPVRSSDIRSAIAAGDLERARELLGRRYSVVGEAAPSSDRASVLAFPLPVALPPAGAYRAIVGSLGGPGPTRDAEGSVDAVVDVEEAGIRLRSRAVGRVRVEFS